MWRGASDEERARLQERLDAAPFVSATTSTGWRTIALRACVGGTLLLIGAVLLSKVGALHGAAIGVIFGAFAVFAGFLVLFAPWWLRTLRDLSSERRERVRAQERADVAAHLHDSVLQTLLLIQKAAAEPAEVVRLARNQERELRHWLFDPKASARSASGADTFATLTAAIERDVEDAYGVGVELVVVGDCDRRRRGARDPRRRARGGRQRREVVRDHRASRCSPRSSRRACRCSSVTSARASSPPTSRRDRRGIDCSIRERMVRYGGPRGRAQHARAGHRGRARAAPGPRGPMSDAEAPRVFLVDDHALIRSGIRAELADAVTIVGEADEVDAAIELIVERQPDVVLLDVHMPGGGGLAVLEARRQALP